MTIETQLAEAHNTIDAMEFERESDLADLRRLQDAYDALYRQLTTADALAAYWQRQHGEAWTLIGRIDYALEMIIASNDLRGARRWAAKMRKEIAR